MIYVFDNNSLSNVLNHYYRDRFPSFWEKLDGMIQNKRVISVREVQLELEERFDKASVNQLKQHNGDFFEAPTPEDLSFITEIYSVPHFRQNLTRKKLLEGGPYADPFIIAKAKTKKAIVVTEESAPKNAARIPNICAHFGVDCMKLQGFLVSEDWRF